MHPCSKISSFSSSFGRNNRLVPPLGNPEFSNDYQPHLKDGEGIVCTDVCLFTYPITGRGVPQSSQNRAQQFDLNWGTPSQLELVGMGYPSGRE